MLLNYQYLNLQSNRKQKTKKGNYLTGGVSNVYARAKLLWETLYPFRLLLSDLYIMLRTLWTRPSRHNNRHDTRYSL